MNLTQYLIFEICRECNLGKVHKRCPNLHRERYAAGKSVEAVADRQIVEIAEGMYRRHGFRGRIGWHYYNEPLVAAERMFAVMDQITGKVPEAEFVLWTNGTLLPEDCREFGRFAEIHVTDYRLKKHPVRNRRALKKANKAVEFHRWGLDDRLHSIGEEPNGFAPCQRMFTEFIVDYYGNVRLCCYDWRGLASIGNVQETPLADLVEKWQEVRRQISGEAMDPNSPAACLRCKMRCGQVSDFGPAGIGQAAREAMRNGEY